MRHGEVNEFTQAQEVVGRELGMRSDDPCLCLISPTPILLAEKNTLSSKVCHYAGPHIYSLLPGAHVSPVDGKEYELRDTQ